MPITYQHPLHIVDQAAFKRIDYTVMGAAFELHNELGQLFDEEIYQTYLSQKLRDKGYSTTSEFHVKLTHQSFSKDYYVDLMVEQSVSYELKASDELTASHESQLLNYLLLCDLQHGKLINFKAPSVKGRFVSSTLTQDDRKQYSIDTSSWSKHTGIPILSTLESLLADWGTHLSINLYREALLHLLRAPEYTPSPIPLTARDQSLGHVNLPLIDQSTMLYVTGINKGFSHHEKHLKQLLKLSPLQTIQWVNFNQSTIQLKSVTPC